MEIHPIEKVLLEVRDELVKKAESKEIKSAVDLIEKSAKEAHTVDSIKALKEQVAQVLGPQQAHFMGLFNRVEKVAEEHQLRVEGKPPSDQIG